MRFERFSSAILPLIFFFPSSLALAQADRAVGLWKREEPTRTAMIRVWEEDGKLMGKVESGMRKDGADRTPALCIKCPGDKKNKPLIGLVVIWDMVKRADRWTGGKILEPTTGRIYNGQIEPTSDGKQLKVRGTFLFFSKTETWYRIR
jgi:uncharacterized protein (DUF2147 family)